MRCGLHARGWRCKVICRSVLHQHKDRAPANKCTQREAGQIEDAHDNSQDAIPAFPREQTKGGDEIRQRQ